MPPKTKALVARRARPEEKQTAIAEMADDIERVISLGERLVGMVGGTEALLKAGADKLLAPAIKRVLETRLRELEQENGYMREALLALVEREGPIYVDRPDELGRLEITVNVRNKTISIERVA